MTALGLGCVKTFLAECLCDPKVDSRRDNGVCHDIGRGTEFWRSWGVLGGDVAGWEQAE